MKRIFAVLLLITLTSVAFTSQANVVNHKVEFLVSECSPDYVVFATMDAQEVYQVINITETSVEIASSEVEIPDIVPAIINKINKVYYAQIQLPIEVGLTNIKPFNSNSTSHAKIHLPYEVGLTRSNI